MLNSIDQHVYIQHPILGACRLPSKGKLKWIGGNLGLGCPVCNEVLDSEGVINNLSLGETLDRIDEFDGSRGDVSIKDNLIANGFSAYKYNLLTSEEKVLFEKYIHDNISTINPTDAAQILILNK